MRLGKRLSTLAAVAFDPGVLKVVAPAYALPFVDLAAGFVGFPAAASVWYLLFGPAVGLHALLALSVAYRAAAPERANAALPTVDEVSRELATAFDGAHSDEGANAVRDLSREFAQLQPVLARRRATDSVVVAQMPALALETYSQGLSVLRDALELLQASSPAERARLEDEYASVQREIAAMKADPEQAGRVRIREERLASNRELLGIMNRQRERVDELFFQAERCEASLRRARMELAGMQADGSEDAVSTLVETLRLTINHARGVQDEMRRLSSPNTT